MILRTVPSLLCIKKRAISYGMEAKRENLYACAPQGSWVETPQIFAICLSGATKKLGSQRGVEKVADRQTPTYLPFCLSTYVGR